MFGFWILIRVIYDGNKSQQQKQTSTGNGEKFWNYGEWLRIRIYCILFKNTCTSVEKKGLSSFTIYLLIARVW